VVAVLMGAAMQVWTRSGSEAGGKEEPTLKVVLSALWNLSAHCRKNKVKYIIKYSLGVLMLIIYCLIMITI